MVVTGLSDGVYSVDGRVATLNLVPGSSVYGEELRVVDGLEYRMWNPYRSKPAAAFKKGLRDFPVASGDVVLYLGVGDGTTASHLSDVVGEDGLIVGVDVSERAFEKFMLLCGERGNLVPVLSDAGRPSEFSEFVPGEVDVVYQDVAQGDQLSILVRNVEVFLKDGGFFVYVVKSRSIDVLRDPKEVFKEEVSGLRAAGLVVESVTYLHPFEKDHAMIVGRKG